MAGGTWRQIACELDGTLEIFHRQNDDELEPLIVDGCTKEIPFLDFSSIVLPKEAFFTSENGSVRSRGRGRSLTNRALGLDKPCRRPGQIATLDEAGSMMKNAESKTLGSQFFGSEYLYEEMFPSLDKSSLEKSDTKPGGRGRTKKTSKEKHLSLRESEGAKNKESGGKSTTNKFSSESSNVFHNSISNENEKIFTSPQPFKDILDESNVGDIVRSGSDGKITPSLMTINKNKTEVFKTVSEKSNCKPRLDLKTNPDGKEHDIVEEILDKDSRITDLDFNKAEFEMAQSLSLETINSADCTTKTSEESFEHLSKKMEIENHHNSNSKEDVEEAYQTERENENKLLSQPNNNQVESHDQFADQLGDKDQDYDGQNLGTKDNIQNDDIEPDHYLFQKWDNEEDTNSDDLSGQENHNPKDSQNICKSLKENDNTCDVVSPIKVSNEENHFLLVEDTIIASNESYSSLSQSSLEGPHCKETTHTEEYLDMEIEPCNVLLENLPFALTEEELQDIIEPYGEMASYNFINKGDDSNKTCSIRMPNSLSGELLVVSVDGLEVHGCRIKATMEYV